MKDVPATILQRPTIGLCTDRIEHWQHASHNVPQTYVEAVVSGACGVPILLPSGNPGLDPSALLAVVDGLLLTGSPSNVEPARYAGVSSAPGTLHDPQRDATTLPLIRAAISMGIPILGICRGFQEMNVAFGGSLHQAVQTLPGALNHAEGTDRACADWYAPCHDVSLPEGGWLRSWIGQPTARVNSLHHQGVDRLAEGLCVEAVAPDGLIEAFRVANAPGFALGVQWHPEASYADDMLSARIFAEFGLACQRYRAANIAGLHA